MHKAHIYHKYVHIDFYKYSPEKIGSKDILQISFHEMDSAAS